MKSFQQYYAEWEAYYEECEATQLPESEIQGAEEWIDARKEDDIRMLELRNSILETFARSVIEKAPNTHAILFTEMERLELTESFWSIGRDAKRLFPDEYKSIDEWIKEGK